MDVTSTVRYRAMSSCEECRALLRLIYHRTPASNASCNKCWTKTWLVRWAQSRLNCPHDLTTRNALRTATQSWCVIIYAIFPRWRVPFALKRRKQDLLKTSLSINRQEINACNRSCTYHTLHHSLLGWGFQCLWRAQLCSTVCRYAFDYNLSGSCSS